MSDPSIAPADARVNGERQALRGSAWKRKASLHARQLLQTRLAPREFDAASRRMVEALARSIEAYELAEGHPGSAHFDVYRALNRLSLDALTDWSSPASKEAALYLAQQCRQIAVQRADGSDEIWDALMPSDALLVERLIDGSLGRDDEVGQEAFDDLVATYVDTFSSVSIRPAALYQVVRHLEILSRFCDALYLVQFGDPALRLTADRLIELVRRIDPKHPVRSDRPEWRAYTGGRRQRVTPGKAAAKKAAAKKAAPRRGRKKESA